MTRRSFTAGGLITILGGSSVVPLFLVDPVAAQEGTDLASLGLPTLDITMTDTGFEGIPAEVEAGRYLVNVDVPESMAEGGGVDFVSPPAGMSTQDVLDAVAMIFGGPPEASPMASPPADGASASPEAEGGEEEEMELMVPLFIYQCTWAGGATGIGGTTAQAVVDLMPGEWVALADDPSGPQQPVTFTVTGDMPTDLPDPGADVMVTFIDFAIDIQGAVTAGDHILMMQNHGAQPHFLVLAKGPDTMTNEMVSMLFESEMTGATPEAMPFDPEKDLMFLLSSASISIEMMQWVPITLEAGTYLAACFFPTAGEGLPHAFHGMHTVFTVE
jgi:hypothetical protein